MFSVPGQEMMRRVRKFLVCKRQEKQRQQEYLREEGDEVCKTLTVMWDNCCMDSGTVKDESASTVLV